MLSAAAKVNLTLEVLGRRADGYHEIATVMQTVDLADRIVLEEAEGLELRTAAPGIPTDARTWRCGRRSPCATRPASAMGL